MSFSQGLFLFLCIMACAFKVYVLGRWLQKRDPAKWLPPSHFVKTIRKNLQSKEASNQADACRKRSRTALMNLSSALQYLLFLGIVTAMVKPLGGYMERVFSGKRTALDGLCRPVERVIYRIGGVDSSQEMTASKYATCFLLFGAISTLLLFLILRLQNHFPWFYISRISNDALLS